MLTPASDRQARAIAKLQVKRLSDFAMAPAGVFRQIIRPQINQFIIGA